MYLQEVKIQKEAIIRESEIQIRFFGELKDFLHQNRRGAFFTHFLKGNPSVKDTIESLGVPHTEVDCILINGKSVSFSSQVQNGDKIKVYPLDKSFRCQSTKHLIPKFPRKIRFILDAHLGKLARYLRLLGFDTLYRKDYADSQIVELARKEKRLVCTRDIGLLKNKDIRYGYWVRATDAKRQLKEIIRRFHMDRRWRPFCLCLECNGKIRRIAKKKIARQLPPKTKDYYHAFYICLECKKIYWQGSHFAELNKFISQIKKSIRNKKEL